MPGRVLNLMRGLAEVAAQTAAQEASRDAERVLGGVITLVAGGVLLLMSLVLADVAGVAWLQQIYGWPWTQAIAVVAAPHAFIGLVLMLWARSRLRQPVLNKTREMVGKTMKVMVGP